MFSANNKVIKMLTKMSMDANSNYVFKWSDCRRRFSIINASQLFISVMLDKMMITERAWEAGKQFVDIYYNTDDIWYDIKSTHLNRLRSIIKTGFNNENNETDYAGSFSGIDTQFADRLKNNARLMVDKYDGDPRNIWNVTPDDVELIYERFLGFYGIGDALAKMAQFMLVRDYGVAGGIESKRYLRAKPDRHVRKVIKRLGLCNSDKTNDVIMAIDNIGFESQADIDAILFNIGREFCFKSDPSCGNCPFNNVCSHNI